MFVPGDLSGRRVSVPVGAAPDAAAAGGAARHGAAPRGPPKGGRPRRAGHGRPAHHLVRVREDAEPAPHRPSQESGQGWQRNAFHVRAAPGATGQRN